MIVNKKIMMHKLISTAVGPFPITKKNNIYIIAGLYLSLKCNTLSLNLDHRRKDLAPACVIIQSLVLFSLFSSKLA